MHVYYPLLHVHGNVHCTCVVPFIPRVHMYTCIVSFHVYMGMSTVHVFFIAHVHVQSWECPLYIFV